MGDLIGGQITRNAAKPACQKPPSLEPPPSKKLLAALSIESGGRLRRAPLAQASVPGRPGASLAPLFPLVDRPQCMDVAQSNLTGGLGYTPSVRRGFAAERSGSPFSRRDRSFPALRPCPGDGLGHPRGPTSRQSSITNARRCFRPCVSPGTTRKGPDGPATALQPVRPAPAGSYLQPAPLPLACS